jgi:hypothetical protein
MVYDLVFIGYDSDIGPSHTEKLGILTTVDIYGGYRFGIINKLSNDKKWESYNNKDLVKLAFEVKSGVEFAKGTLFEIFNSSGTISVRSNDKDITDSFELVSFDGISPKLIEHTGTFLTLHSGYFTTSEILLGTVLDVISIQVPRVEVEGLLLPRGLIEKDIVLTDDPNDGGGMVDIGNCRLCDIILIILDPDNWINFPNTPADDVDLEDFNLQDCAELDCDGVIELSPTDSCIISVVSYPCEGETVSYKWQENIGGIYTTIASGNGPLVLDLILDKNGDFRLIILCDDGCEIPQEFTVNCIPDDCDATLTIDTVGCELIATVTGCESPIYNWYYIGKNGSISDAGNTPTITANTDFDYYLIVTGCCNELKSNYYNMKGCLNCECSQTLEANDCIVTAVEDGCEGFNDLWEFSIHESGPWESIDFHGLIYTADSTGFYRRTLFKEDCDDISNVEEVVCNLDCADFNAYATFDEDCNIVIEYSGCSEVIDVQISYAEGIPVDDCSDPNTPYAFGGGSIISNDDNGQSGTIVIDPFFEESCYIITLTCANGCIITLTEHTGNCCAGILAIDPDANCEIIVLNNPCSDNLEYIWYLNEAIYSTGTGAPIPPLIPTENGLYKLEVSCDTCKFYSNIVDINCVAPPCASSVDISPEDCLLTANITNCPSAIIQWQIWNGTNFVDISGENGETYLATDTTQIQVVITGCDNCEDEEPLSDTYTPIECEDMCNCELDVAIDTDDCILTSTNSDCMNVGDQYWWQSNDEGVTWFILIEATDPTTYVPMKNAWYKSVIKFNDGCPDAEDIVVVNCLEYCDIDITLSITDDCNLKAKWDGCGAYESTGFGWYFSNNDEMYCGGNSNFPLSLPPGGTIIEIENNPSDESGYIIIDPTQGEGCYFFNFQCEGCEVIQKSKWVGPCCEDEPEIVLVTEEEEICDYCWANSRPGEIENIDVVLPNGTPLALMDSPNFSFPYCPDNSCNNTIFNLVADINSWFNENAYLGLAVIGPIQTGGCVNEAPFHIIGSNVIFIESDVDWGPTSISFPYQAFNCDILDVDYLTVTDTCEGATYLWSDGSMVEIAPIPEDWYTDIYVIVTCPDGCVDTIFYDWEEFYFKDENNESEVRELIQIEKKIPAQTKGLRIYPNPTRTNFHIETGYPITDYLKVSIYNTQGQLIKTNYFSNNATGTYTIETNTLLGGMYFIRTEIDGEVKSVDKLLVIK